VSIQPLVAVTLSQWLCCVQVGCELVWYGWVIREFLTCTQHGHRQLPEIVLTQFVSLDDEHDVLETCRELKIINKYIEKNCASRWSFTKNQEPTCSMEKLGMQDGKCIIKSQIPS